jgi:uncharacterized protein
MVLKLRELFDSAVDELPFECELTAEEFDAYGFELAAPISLRGLAVNRARVVTLKMRAEFTAKLVCDRCLDEFERDFAYDFEHTLVRELAGNDDEDYVVCPNDLLDVSQLAAADIKLELPTKILCSEDCEGFGELSFGEC